jgi:hypothetical protein
MSTFNATRCPNVVIASGQTRSNVVRADYVYNDAEMITLYAPTALDVTTFSLQVTDNPDANPIVWNTLNDGVVDIVAPAANRACTYPANNWAAFSILAGSAVAAERVWRMTKTHVER